jgi:predicted SAM-dependent methyltransferase
VDRIRTLLDGLALDGLGLEVAPYFNPTIRKGQYNIYYVDYTDNETLKKKASENPGAKTIEIPEIDWVWVPRKKLRACIPDGMTFDYAIASHVVEHVPNTIGWLNEILEVMKVGAKLALAVPDRCLTMDFYRRETTLGDLIGNWIEAPSIPTVTQVMDFLSQGFDNTQGNQAVGSIPFESAPRHYSDVKALEFAIWAHNEQHYLDTHCTVWTPDSFINVMQRVVGLGLMNVEISPPIQYAAGSGEFIVQLTNKGSPRISRDSVCPPSPQKISNYRQPMKNNFLKTLLARWKSLRV